MQALGVVFYLRWAEIGLIPQDDWAEGLALNIDGILADSIETAAYCQDSFMLPSVIVGKPLIDFGMNVEGNFVNARDLLICKLKNHAEPAVLRKLAEDGRTPEILANDLVNWCRRGYRRARARYARCFSTYQMMAHTVPEMVKSLDQQLEGLREGDRIRISLNLRNLAWNIFKLGN